MASAQAMEKPRLGIAGVALVFAGVWLALLPLHDRAIVPMDEGHLVSMSSWILDGHVPYRDLYTGIFPGIYLIGSGLLWLFGPDVVVTRLAMTVVNASTAALLFCVARRTTRPIWAPLAPALHVALCLVGFPVFVMLNYSTVALLMALLSLVSLLRYLETGRFLDGLLLGAAGAAAILTKQNFGGLTFLAVVACLLCFRRESALGATPLLRLAAPALAGGALVSLPVLGWLAAEGALVPLVESAVIGVVGPQLTAFDNPIPPLFGSHPEGGRFAFLYTPPLLFSYWLQGETVLGLPVSEVFRSFAVRLSYGLPLGLLVLGFLLAWGTRLRVDREEARAGLIAVVFAAFFFPGIFPSAIWSHLAFVLPPLFPVAALVLDRLDRLLAGRPAALGLRAATLAAAALVFLALLRAPADIRRWNGEPLALERASLHVTRTWKELLEGAVRFIEDCAEPGEPIFVVPEIPIVWFLTGRPNPTPYDVVIPGAVDADLIVQRLEQAGVRCVVHNPRMYPEFPPLAELYPQLTDYLDTRFRLERRIGGAGTEWLGLVRR